MWTYLTDMDGVLVHEEHLVPGADEFLAELRANDIRFLVLTNNSIYTPRDLRARLGRTGLDVPEDAIWTSALARNPRVKPKPPRTRQGHRPCVRATGDHLSADTEPAHLMYAVTVLAACRFDVAQVIRMLTTGNDNDHKQARRDALVRTAGRQNAPRTRLATNVIRPPCCR